ncbi:MAG TPA: RNA polymerase sigma factor [Pirellulales bacterium]|nr:RNA polymerase sigma factor [Pirellulales bacterium]
MPDEVSELVRRSLSGEQSAMTELVDRFRGEVFGLCFRMLGHRQDAEDVTQESFVRALRSLANWDSRRDFRPWLLAIAGNRCRTMLASRRRLPKPSLEVDELIDARSLAGERHLGEEVALALARLREEYRQAFVLYHEQQLNYAEIAEVLGCPVGTVKTWVHRARRELADHLRRRGVVEERNDAV